ncbi:MAG TPA: hypothetical protein P5137_03495 [Candidatus Brocadiia bacterium]|nr:hypothetical protein [Candidatus Brocadiia bacterium]
MKIAVISEWFSEKMGCAGYTLAMELLGWRPQPPCAEGVHRTIRWHFANKNLDVARRILERGGLTKGAPGARR